MARGTASQVINELEAFTEGLIKELNESTTNFLFEDTPELTGFAETNWVPSIGAEVVTPTGSRTAVTKSAQDAGIALVNSTYRLPLPVYISNPVEYIVDLNQGSSAKAPAGFVQTSIAKGIRSVI